MKLNPILTAAAAMIPAAALVAVGVTAALRSVPGRELPVFHEVAPFSFQERSGRTVSREDLRGRVWIADFIFTSCAGICPGMTANFRKVDQALRDVSGQVVLVSFTVDPERDTEEKLTAYANSQGAGDHWLFLRGPREEVVRLSREGFLLGAVSPQSPRGDGGASGSADPATPAPEPGQEPIAHDRHFVLVDRLGRIRGYYDGLEDAPVAAVARDARALLRETPPAP